MNSGSSSPSTVFTARAIEADLPTRCVGKSCIVYDRTESTNDVLRAVMSDRRYDGLAVFANEQTRGRGRDGRLWQAKGDTSVLCSVLLLFDGSVSQFGGPMNLAVAIAAAQAVNASFPVNAAIKWPNDLYVADKKLGGILIEASQTDPNTCAFVIGIGINVCQEQEDFPEEFVRHACSIATVLGRPGDPSDRLTLGRQWLIELDRTRDRVISGDLDRLRQDWLALAANRDTAVTVEHGDKRFQARIIDIDPRDNSLLIRDDQGLIWHLTANVSRVIL